LVKAQAEMLVLSNAREICVDPFRQLDRVRGRVARGRQTFCQNGVQRWSAFRKYIALGDDAPDFGYESGSVGASHLLGGLWRSGCGLRCSQH
jgi:hypothetical protein